MDLEHPEVEAEPIAASKRQPRADAQPDMAARIERRRAARAKQAAAYADPDAYALARREQLLVPYRRAVEGTKAQVARYGFLDRIRDPEGYEKARARLEFAQSAQKKAEHFIEERFEDLRDEARRKFAAPTPVAAEPSPSGAGIEIDPRHRSASAPSR